MNVDLSGTEVHSQATSSSFCIPTVVHCGLETAVDQMFRQAVQIYWGHQDDKERRLNLLINTLLNELASIARNSQPDAEDWILDLLHRIASERGRMLTLAEAAEISQMTSRTFSARFRKVMGKSFHQYQMSTKLEMAYNALRTGRYSVKTASAEYSFSDPYYFSRVFKQQFGVAPSEISRGEPSTNINRPNMHY